MTIPQILQKMIRFSAGDVHDVDHLVRVWAYARTIGQLEQLDEETQFILEAAAITHDIACPLCREKYGSAEGRYQELEGPALAEAFLSDAGLSAARMERIKYLIGHHHTFRDIDGIDYQILVEADYIANAAENGWGREKTEPFLQNVARTPSGKDLIRSVLGV